jgi:hypothetical protein
MKKIKLVKMLIAMLPLAILVTLMACEGPAGAPGKDGADGTDGTNGTNGTNASESCRTCHNSTSQIATKQLQLNHSMHSEGTAWLEGTRNSCAPCHTSAGFTDVIANNPPKNKYNATAASLTDPTPLTCRSCHKTHTAYDATDWDLKTTAAIDMLIDTTKTLTLDLGGSSNLCAKCHQPRIVKQMDFNGAPGTTYAALNSFRWGTHYGTQGAIFGGKGGFEFTGTYTNSAHTVATTCVDCHSAAATGMSGGHTFSVVNEETGALNTNGCLVSGCHSSATTLTNLINTDKVAITDLITQLGDKLGFMQKADLNEDGIKEYTGYVDIYDPTSNPDGLVKFPGSTSTWTQPQKDHNNTLTAITFTNKQAAAAANFQLVLRDGSNGVHNFAYAKALSDGGSNR